jgi:hypothetical protein
MEHHRNHEGREQHIHPSSSHVVPVEDLESPDLSLESLEGSEQAPTPKATEQEVERQRVERDPGRAIKR